MGEHLAWRVPRLELSGTPLSKALPMFNEHGRVHLRLADPALGRLQLSGVLRADDTESLLRLLEGEFALTAERRGDELVLRSRR
jgi:transmembrane sensor